MLRVAGVLKDGKEIVSLRRSKGRQRKSRHVVKSRSYRSQGEDGDHGDDDEAWELRERSVSKMKKAAAGVEESKRKKGVLDRAQPNSQQRASQPQLFGPRSKKRRPKFEWAAWATCGHFSDIDTHAHYSVQLKYRHFTASSRSLAQNSSASTADQQDTAPPLPIDHSGP